MIKMKDGSWKVKNIADFFGWDVTVIEQPESGSMYFTVKAIQKRTREVRIVKAHVITIPMEAIENMGDGNE